MFIYCFPDRLFLSGAWMPRCAIGHLHKSSSPPLPPRLNPHHTCARTEPQPSVLVVNIKEAIHIGHVPTLSVKRSVTVLSAPPSLALRQRLRHSAAHTTHVCTASKRELLLCQAIWYRIQHPTPVVQPAVRQPTRDSRLHRIQTSGGGCCGRVCAVDLGPFRGATLHVLC